MIGRRECAIEVIPSQMKGTYARPIAVVLLTKDERYWMLIRCAQSAREVNCHQLDRSQEDCELQEGHQYG
jgi:hypothetical protein